MSKRMKIGVAAAACAAVAVAAGGIAYAVGGGDGEALTGANADRAARAALDATGGGEVLEVENADDGASGYEVEVRRPDGGVVEVMVDPEFVAGAAQPGENDQGESERDGD